METKNQTGLRLFRSHASRRNPSFNEFFVESDIIDVDLLVVFNGDRLVLPRLHLAFKQKFVTGLQITFCTDSAKQLEHSTEDTSITRNVYCSLPTAQADGIKTHVSVKVAGFKGTHINVTTNQEQFSFYRKTLDSIKQEACSFIQLKGYGKNIQNQPVPIDFVELYSATIAAAQNHNLALKKMAHPSRNKPRRGQLSLTSKLYLSTVLEKRIWWLNLVSSEATADRAGIHHQGKCFFPSGSENKLHFFKFLMSGRDPVVTLYTSPRSQCGVFWVYRTRFIPLVRCVEPTPKLRLKFNDCKSI